MGMPTIQEILTGNLAEIIEQHADGSSSGATATEAGVTGKKHFITSVEAWSDGAVLLQLKDDTTIIEQIKALANTSFEMKFFPPVAISADKKAEAKIANSTSNCHITLYGFTVDE